MLFLFGIFWVLFSSLDFTLPGRSLPAFYILILILNGRDTIYVKFISLSLNHGYGVVVVCSKSIIQTFTLPSIYKNIFIIYYIVSMYVYKFFGYCHFRCLGYSNELLIIIFFHFFQAGDLNPGPLVHKNIKVSVELSSCWLLYTFYYIYLYLINFNNNGPFGNILVLCFLFLVSDFSFLLFLKQETGMCLITVSCFLIFFLIYFLIYLHLFQLNIKQKYMFSIKHKKIKSSNLDMKVFL